MRRSYSQPLVRDGTVATAVAPERSHLLEACSFLSAALFHCYRPHVPFLVGNSIDSHNWKAAFSSESEARFRPHLGNKRQNAATDGTTGSGLTPRRAFGSQQRCRLR
jgi:hypothetical protein